MPKRLELVRPVAAQGGVLIKHADLQTGLRATRLIADAQRRASRIVTRAEQQADDFRRQGYLQGYGAGVLAGADALARVLQDARQLSQQLSSALQQALREQMETILPQPELGMALAEDWLAQHPQADMAQLVLHIPQGWQQAGYTLRQPFSAMSGSQVQLHGGRHFAIEYGNSVYEFSPEAVSDDWQREIFQRVGFYALASQCQRIGDAALEELFQRWHAAPEASPSAAAGDPLASLQQEGGA
jgi:hypothetical protein